MIVNFPVFGKIKPTGFPNYEYSGSVEEITSVPYKMIKFTSNGVFKVDRDVALELFLVGGGGAGGYGGTNNGGGGGGGGYTATGVVHLTANTNYSLTIGAGGTAVSSADGNDGKQTKFASFLTANGGIGGTEGGIIAGTGGDGTGAGGTGGGVSGTATNGGNGVLPFNVSGLGRYGAGGGGGSNVGASGGSTGGGIGGGAANRTSTAGSDNYGAGGGGGGVTTASYAGSKGGSGVIFAREVQG